MSQAESGLRNDVLLPDAVRHYIVEHQLEKVVTSAMNRVILEMPQDPYARLAEELNKSSFSLPRFAFLRHDASKPRRLLQFHVVVASRGVNIRIQPLILGDVIQAENAEEKWISFLQDFFQKSFGGIYVDDYLSLEEHMGDLSGAPGAVDVPRFQLALGTQLLEAAAAATNLDVLAFFQHCLAKVGCERVSPRLDRETWRDRWPRWATSLFGASALRLAVALPMAENLQKLLEALQAAKAEAMRALQADKTTASLVVDGVCHFLPTLLQTVQAARKAVDTVAQGSEGILFAYAEEAWKEEEQVYELEPGKPKTLEELVELYVELTEEEWISTVVNPFTAADFSTGCELLKAQRPQLLILRDEAFAQVDEELPFGCLWRLTANLPSNLKEYAQYANAWHDWARGFGKVCCLPETFPPRLMESLLACGDVEVIYAPDLTELKDLAQQMDDVLLRAVSAVS